MLRIVHLTKKYGDKRLDIDVPKSLGFKTIYVNENGDIKRVEELSPRLIKKL